MTDFQKILQEFLEAQRKGDHRSSKELVKQWLSWILTEKFSLKGGRGSWHRFQEWLSEWLQQIGFSGWVARVTKTILKCWAYGSEISEKDNENLWWVLSAQVFVVDLDSKIFPGPRFPKPTGLPWKVSSEKKPPESVYDINSLTGYPTEIKGILWTPQKKEIGRWDQEGNERGVVYRRIESFYKEGYQPWESFPGRWHSTFEQATQLWK